MSNHHFFKYKNSTIGDLGNTKQLYFLNENHNLVPEHEAKKFVVKEKLQNGFKEWFGIINNPKHIIDDSIPVPKLPNLFETRNNLYTEYGLNIDKIVKAENKNVEIFIPESFIEDSPRKFANISRNVDKIAEQGGKRRDRIYEFYKTFIPYVECVESVDCNSVAYLYSSLNNGEKWKEGMEFYGFVDGFYIQGIERGDITVSIDTNTFDLHTITHETGHANSYLWNDELFQEYYAIASNKNEEPISDYAKSEISECAAESFAFYFMNGTERKLLKEKCPMRYSFMKKVEYLGKNAFVNTDFKQNEQLTNRFHLYDKVVW